MSKINEPSTSVTVMTVKGYVSGKTEEDIVLCL